MPADPDIEKLAREDLALVGDPHSRFQVNALKNHETVCRALLDALAENERLAAKHADLRERTRSVLVDVSQLLQGFRPDESWSEWDQSVVDRVSELLCDTSPAPRRAPWPS